MIKKLFSFYPLIDKRRPAFLLSGLAIIFAIAMNLFSTPIWEVFETQKTETALILSDLSHCDFGYLPVSNPQSSLTKNQETQPLEKIFFEQSFDHLSTESSIRFVSEIDLNHHFNTILTHIHPSHFYF